MEVINNLENIIKLPENINGLEIKHSPYFLSIESSDIPPYIETCRIFQEVYMHITCARYCLLMANDTEHPQISEDTETYNWYRCLNANTSIMWYNAAFDILLQTLWLYKGLYKNHDFNGKKKKPLYYTEITPDSLPKILKGCKIEYIYKYIKDIALEDRLKKFQKDHSEIHNLANSLKHRNSIKYKELYKRPIITLATFYEKGGKIIQNEKKYNSSKTLTLYELRDIIDKLSNYHIDFIGLINGIFDFLKLEEVFKRKNTI